MLEYLNNSGSPKSSCFLCSVFSFIHTTEMAFILVSFEDEMGILAYLNFSVVHCLKKGSRDDMYSHIRAI